MKVIILAAGVGQRLGGVSGGQPKCLLRIGDATLLARHLACIAGFGISDVSIVTGFRHDAIEQAIGELNSGFPVRTFFNPDFRSGSVVSLAAAAPALASGEDIVLMDADVLYDCSLLGRLFDTRHENCFLLDRDFEPGDEPVKLCLQNGRIVEFSKKVPDGLAFDLQGESVGFFRFSSDVAAELADRARAFVESERAHLPYEDVIRELALHRPALFGYEDITGIPWIEIDFPEDIERAGRDVLARIEEAVS